MRRLLLPLLLLTAMLSSARAQADDELSVFLVTIGPGDAIFEKFGHNGILIVDRSTGEQMVHHWGVFDFKERRFFINFALGHLNYSMGTEEFGDMVAWYRHQNRSIQVQELNLTADQKLKLRDFCRWNQREENRFYAYNYFTDNCSTRVRDALDLAVDGQLKTQLEPRSTGTTWRWHTRRLTQDSIFWYTLLNTVLASATDRSISQWEEAFLPVKLSQAIESVTINGGPIVKGAATVFESTRPPEPQRPPNWIPHYFLAGVVVGAGIALAAWRGWRRSFVIAAAAYALVIGLCGAFGVWVWLFSAHWAAWRNENLFAYSPLALPLGVLLLMMRTDRPRPRPRLGVQQAVVWLAIAIAASSLIGLLLAPVLPQVVGEPTALVLPINLALAWGVWEFVRRASAQPQAVTT